MAAFMPSKPVLISSHQHPILSSNRTNTLSPNALATSQPKPHSKFISRRPRSTRSVLQDAIRNRETEAIPSLLAARLSKTSQNSVHISMWRDAVMACTYAHDYDSINAALQVGLTSSLSKQLRVSYFMAPLRSLARAARWRTVFTVLDTMWIVGGAVKPDERLLVSLANDAVNNKLYRTALKMFAIMRSHDITMGPIAYSVLLKSHGRATNVVAVKQVLDEIYQSDFEMDTVLFNSAIDALIRCSDIASAEKLLLNEKYNSILDEASFNTVLKGFAERALLAQAYRIIQQMEEKGYTPNDVTRNTLVSACVRAGNFDQAWSILNTDYRSQSNQLDFLSSNSGNSQPSNSSKSRHEQLSKEMDSVVSSVNQVKNDSSTKNVDTGKADKNLKNRQKQMSIALTSLLVGLAENGQISDALILLQNMIDRKVLPSAITYAALIGACFRQGAISEAIEIYQSISKSDGNEKACNLLTEDVQLAYIAGLCRTGDLSHVTRAAAIAVNTFQQQEDVSNSNGIKTKQVSIDCHNLILDGYVRCGEISCAENYIKEMEENGISPTVVSYTTLIKGYGAIGEYKNAHKAFAEIANRGLKVDRVALNAFLNICARGGNMRLALKVLSKMEHIGGAMSPSAYSYTPIIAAYLRRGKQATAWEMYRRMRKQGIPVSDITVEHMCGYIVAIAVKSRTGVLSATELENAAHCGAEVLHDARKDGVSGRVLRKCRRKLVLAFTGTKARKHLLGLNSPEFRSASEDIFEKHGWNDIDSGWRVI